MGAAPSAVPGASPGLQAASISQVREAIKILEKALPGLGTGTDPWKSVMNAMSSLGKIAPPSSEQPGLQKTTLQGLTSDANKNAMMDAVRGATSPAMASAGGGGPGPGGLPPTPAMPPSLAA